MGRAVGAVGTGWRRVVMGGAVLVAVLGAACGDGEPAGPGVDPVDPPGGGVPPGGGSGALSVAFVGNSLTFEVPELVQAMADADGRAMTHAVFVEPNSSLEDHWSRGTPDALQQLGPDVVVMQQGPSTLPENREHLIHWSGEFADAMRRWGGEPALLMVWPSVQRLEYMPEVWTSYRAAADAVGGLFIPGGQTWVEAWAITDTLSLYGPDGIHASAAGALAAAQTVYAALFDLPADSVPELDVGVSPGTQELLRSALAASLAKARGQTPAPDVD